MKVLLATDGSAASEVAAKLLTRFAWSPQDRITVFHAIYAVPFPEDPKFHLETLTALKKELAPRILDSEVQVLKPVNAAISVDIGEFAPGECTPDQCILKAAEASQAELIVMGAHGVRRGVSAFLGGVTRLVTAQSPRPVLVARSASQGSEDGMHVLVAVDGTGPSLEAVGLLTSLPFPEDAQVTILHVIASTFSDIPERFVPEINERMKDAVAGVRTREFARSESILQEARAVLRERFRKISVLSKVGDPSTEIVNAALAGQVDIIAAGCRGLKGVRRIMGSVTRNVLAHAPCSVLVGRAESPRTSSA
jgi:nucleotide-binding universal stress UspA family protein